MKPLPPGIIAGIAAFLLLAHACLAQPPLTPRDYDESLKFDSNFPDYHDEGGAPASVVLRLQPGDSNRDHWRRFEYREPLGQSVIDLHVVDRLTNSDGNLLTTKTTISAVQIERDDLKLAPFFHSLLTARPVTTVTDNQAHVVSTTPNGIGEAFDFPTAPVSAGSDWLGSMWMESVQITVVVRVERIIRHQNHTFVELSMTAPPMPATERLWFDASAGTFDVSEGLNNINSRDPYYGWTTLARQYDLPGPPAPAAHGKHAPNSRPAHVAVSNWPGGWHAAW